MARSFPPVLRAFHQFAKLLLRVRIIETLRPKMSRITKHNLPALKQERMIVDWVGGKTSFHRQFSNRDTDLIELRAIRKSKAAPPRCQPAEQADKPGAEERDANRHAHRHRPAGNEMRPQKRKHEKVGPNHDFEIVPTPWRRFDEERQNKNRCRP